MSDHSDDIDQLKLEIFNLKAEILVSAIRLKAFQNLAMQIWKVQNPSSPSAQSTLSAMERARANEVLREYADDNPAMASILKKYLEDTFGKLSSDE